MAVNANNIFIGSKVTFISQGTSKRKEKGRVKSFSDEKDKVFVVYKCNDDWENYKNYTGEITSLNFLELGWEEDIKSDKQTIDKFLKKYG